MGNKRLEEIETGSVKIKSIHVKGKLTRESKEFVERRLAKSRIALRPLIQNIEDSRKITEDDLARHCNTRD